MVGVGGGGEGDHIKDNSFSDSELVKVYVWGESEPLELFWLLNSPPEQQAKGKGASTLTCSERPETLLSSCAEGAEKQSHCHREK